MFTSDEQISPPSLNLKLQGCKIFAQMNSQGSIIEKNTHAQRVQMQKNCAYKQGLLVKFAYLM